MVLLWRTDAITDAPILWPPHVKSQLIGKDLMIGKIEGKRRGWQRLRWLDSITSSIVMNLSELQEIVKTKGSLMCCSLWGCKEFDMTE